MLFLAKSDKTDDSRPNVSNVLLFIIYQSDFCRANVSIIAPVTASANPSALEIHGRIHLMTREAKRLRFRVSVLFDVVLWDLCSAQQHQSGS